MAASIVGTPTVYSGGNLNDHVVPQTDGEASGRLLVLFVMAAGNDQTITPPSGFTQQGLQSHGNGLIGLYTKRAGSAEPANYTVSLFQNRRAIIFLAALQDDDVNAPVNLVEPASGSSVSPLCPAGDTTVNDTLNLLFYGASIEDAVFTQTDAGYPAGATGVYHRANAGGGTDVAAGFAHKPQASAGSTGTAEWSNAWDAARAWSAFTVAIAPAGGGGGLPGTPELRQTNYRGFNDDAAPDSSTGKAPADTPWEQAVDETFCARVVIAEVAGEAKAGASFKWQARLNGGAWFDVTTASSVVKAVASANYADGGDTTQRVGTSLAFIADNNGLDEDGSFGAVSFVGSDEMEAHGAFQLVGADVNPGDTINLRVVEADGTLLGAYLQTPAITVEGQVVSANWFIDSVNGSDVFDGQSIATAVRTIAELKTRVSAGDTVSWARGGVWRERFDFAVPLNHVAHGTGAKPKITAADDIKGTTGVWAEVQTNVWRRPYTPENTPPTVLLVDGEFLFDPAASLANLTENGEWHWDQANLLVSVFATSNPALAFDTLELGSREHAAFINTDGNSITDLHFTAGRHALELRGDGNSFLRCQFDKSGRDGVQIRGTARDNEFNACQFVENGQYLDGVPGNQQQQGDHCLKAYDQSSNNTIRNSTFSECGEDCVQVQSSAAGTVLTLEDNTLVNAGEGPLDIKDGDVVLRRNYLECDNPDQTVVTLHNAAQTFTSEGNRYIDLTGGAPALQATDGAAVIISKRDIYKGRVNIANPRGACTWENCLFFWGDLTGGQDYLFRIDQKTGHLINGCTIVAGAGDRAFRAGSGAVAPGITIRNSILKNTGVELIERQSGTLTLEHNLYDTDSATFYDDNGDLQDGTEIIANHDPDGDTGDPLFVNETAEDFHLQSGSPAIGLADPATAPEVDLELRTRGVAPDAGAFQFSAAPSGTGGGGAAILMGL